jgi:hypothetical protein
VGDTTSLVPGFPIRTSSDPRSVDSSPRHIAASHVLHRLPVPRHPPCALKHLQHKKPLNKKKLHINTHKNTNPPKEAGASCVPDARNHYPQIKHHTPPPKDGATTKSHPRFPTRDEEIAGLLPQSPIVCWRFLDRKTPPAKRLLCTQPGPLQTLIASRPTPPQRECLSWCSLERR